MNTGKDQKNILIIDDNPMNLLLTSKILESFGFRVTVAESGRAGLNLLESELPSLILLDISMPEMDGYEVCEVIQNHSKWKQIPVIFLTANTMTEDLVKGFEKGGVDYITKPFKSEELFVRVSTHLELAESRKRILEMNSSRDKLYSIIAHDIRSPLSAILQTVDAIDQGYFDPASDDFKEIIHHLKERTAETSTLLNSLLQWTRLQDEKIVIKLKETNVNTLLMSCLQLLTANANQKNITINFESNSDEFAWCDEVSMHTVFRNLISNAIKFTHENGKIEVRLIPADAVLKVQITDSGIGMSEEVIEKIFDKNLHYTSSGTKNEQGTGLGLMLVKDFVQKNNARLHIESSVGVGTTFTVEIPKSE